MWRAKWTWSPALHSKTSYVKILATQPERLIVDLSRVSFMGSTALAVLINIRHMADQQSTRFQLRGTDRRPVAAPLRVTGLDHLFDIVRSGK